MHLQNYAGLFIFAVFILMVGSFVYRIFKYGGLRGATFGARIERTVGEVSTLKSSKLYKVAVKVHVLNGSAVDRVVGLEFVATSFASYQMMPVSLSAVEARKLIGLLESATSGT